MLSILGNRKIIVSILTMVFLIVGVQGMSYAQTPNLAVGPLTVSPHNTVIPDGKFTISGTITNSGTGASAPTVLRCYRSTDNANSTPLNDTLVGAQFVSGLAAQGSVEFSLPLSAPTAVGTYYYWVQVEPVTGEVGAQTFNNSSSPVALTVQQNAPRPNLTVRLTYSPYGGGYNLGPGGSLIVPPGQRFILNAIVANIGALASDSTTLICEYSTNRISWSDTGITVNIPEHSPNQSGQSGQQYAIHLIAPSLNLTTGIYYYRVRVLPVAGESNVNDNYSIELISITTSSADLVVDPPTVNKSTLAPGESFTLTATVRNNGRGNSAAATLTYYSSTDSTITTADTTISGTADQIGILRGYNTVNQIYPNTSTQTVDLTAPTTPGTYYYGACVSTNSYETNIQNNCSTAVAITVSAPPDLVADIFEFRPNTVAPGARLTLDATVTNDGEGRSARTTLRFYESFDRRFSREEEIDRLTVAELDSNRSISGSIRLIAPATPGTYYYRVQVDEVANEVATTNNTSGYILLYVEQPLTLESVQPSTSTVAPRERLTLTATLRNDGSTTSAREEVTFYRSSDNSITSRDTSIGTGFVNAIAARETGQVSLTLNAPTAAGTYFYGVCLGDATGSDVCPVTEITVVDVSIANIERPPIYWVDADEGTLQSLTGSEIDPFVSSVQNANSIAVDMAGGKVYWTEQTGTSTGRIRRANLDGSNVETVRALNNVPHGIAVDTSNGKLYVTNSRGKVQQMDLDGRNYESNFIINLDSPRGIAVDAAGGKIYWTEQTGEDTGRLQRADLDGSNVETVRALNNIPYGIAVDASNGKLYVTNSRGKIQRFNLDGSNFEWNFIVNLDSPRGIAVDAAAGKVYWAEANGIRRANLNGSNRQDVVTGIGAPAGIALSVAPVSTDAPAAPGAVAANSDATALHANYPNPFNPETWIPYQLQQAADVQISIYSQSGVLVRELSLGYQGAGQYMSRSRAAHWDGRNQVGEPVASGLYFYTLTAGDFSATRRMLILK